MVIKSKAKDGDLSLAELNNTRLSQRRKSMYIQAKPTQFLFTDAQLDQLNQANLKAAAPSNKPIQ